MSGSGIKVEAPATISNLNCGFDVLGMATEIICDEVIGRQTFSGGLRLKLIGPNARATPADPTRNTATVAVLRMLKALGETAPDIELSVKKTINPGSGLGSSAASACAAVVLVNELIGRPFEKKELLPFAIAGEFAADGSYHADNVAPCLLGGTQMVRDIRLLDIHRIYSPKGLFITIATPKVRVLTKEAREVLSPTVGMNQMIRQSANLAAFVHAMHVSDMRLLARSLQDSIVERQRAHLIPRFGEIRQKVLETGVLGFGISGSGPTLFALSDNQGIAHRALDTIIADYASADIECSGSVSTINEAGTKLC